MNWPFARTMIECEEVESTNGVARALVESTALDLPMAVIARRQTRGRGRGQNTWWSDEGSLILTLAIDPARHGLRPEHQPRIALAVAIAVIDTIAPRLPDPVVTGIRWPNDVEAGGRKLGGILPERVETGQGTRVLIGIGLNVTTRLADAPEDVRRMAASLRDLGAIPPDEPKGLVRPLLGEVEKGLKRLAEDDPSLAERWRGLDVLKGRPIRVELAGQLVSGLGAGIDEEGALLVATGRETLRLFGGRVLREP